MGRDPSGKITLVELMQTVQTAGILAELAIPGITTTAATVGSDLLLAGGAATSVYNVSRLLVDSSFRNERLSMPYGGLYTVLDVAGSFFAAGQIAQSLPLLRAAYGVQEVSVTTANAITVVDNKAAGDAVRDAIALREAPAITEYNFSTVGGIRRTDVLKIGEDLVAIESKVGRTGLSTPVRQELARDWWLLRQGQVDKVVWEFTVSDVTGKVGPVKSLASKLEKLGFEVRINAPK